MTPYTVQKQPRGRVARETTTSDETKESSLHSESQMAVVKGGDTLDTNQLLTGGKSARNGGGMFALDNISEPKVGGLGEGGVLK